jgi:hypothetical protein
MVRAICNGKLTTWAVVVLLRMSTADAAPKGGELSSLRTTELAPQRETCSTTVTLMHDGHGSTVQSRRPEPYNWLFSSDIEGLAFHERNAMLRGSRESAPCVVYIGELSAVGSCAEGEKTSAADERDGRFAESRFLPSASSGLHMYPSQIDGESIHLLPLYDSSPKAAICVIGTSRQYTELQTPSSLKPGGSMHRYCLPPASRAVSVNR